MSDEIVAPIDVDDVHVGDTVTVSGRTTGSEPFQVEGIVWEPAHSPGGLWVGPVSLRARGITITDHQPAPEPEPEWDLGTFADITNGSIWVRAVRVPGADPEERVWQTVPASSWWSDANVTDVRPLVVIDPASVDLDGLTRAMFGAYDTGSESLHTREGNAVDAALSFLGIEVPRA